MKYTPHCPHGQDKHECKTCSHARDYWAKFAAENAYRMADAILEARK
jgi:hypothetical protein